MQTRNAILSLLLILAISCTGRAVSPTAVPTSKPSSTPTYTFTPTEIPPTATFTGTPVPGGPCDNPIIPLVTGNHWGYRVTAEKGTYLYDLLVGQRQDIGNINIDVELIDHSHNQDIKELVVCQAGAIDNFPLFFMSMMFADDLDGILNTYKQTGQYAPPYLEFERNNWNLSWKSLYLLEEPVSMEDKASGAWIGLGRSSPIDVSFKTDAKYESVTVPAGSFPRALVVENDYKFVATVVINNMTTAGTLILRLKQWVVPYIGLVRAEVTSASMSIVYGQEESISYKSVLELTEFQSGK
jgi:hypothetical protein